MTNKQCSNSILATHRNPVMVYTLKGGFFLTLLLLLLCLPVPRLEAAVERVGNWTGTSWNGSGNGSMSYTPGVGSDRVMLVAITGEASNTTARVTTVTFGGQEVTPIAAAVRGTGYSNFAWLGYCNEVCIAAATNSTIAVTGTSNVGVRLTAATYQNVEQTNPVYRFATNNAGSSVISASLNTVSGNQVVYLLNYNQTTGTRTASTGFTLSENLVVAGSHASVVADRNTTGAATPLTLSPTSSASSSRTALVAVSLYEKQCSATAPEDLVAVAPHGGQVDLTWSYDGTNNDSYNVYRNGVLIGSSILDSYTDTDVALSTAYSYTVRGYNSSLGCESGNSNVANATTGSCKPTTGPITVTSGQTLSGPNIDLTSLVTANGATVSTYKVSSKLAVDLNQLESFAGGDPKGWSAWTPDNRYNPPGNRDLWTGVTSRTDNTGPSSAPNGSFLYFESTDDTTYHDQTRTLTRNGTLSATNNELKVSFLYNLNGANIKAVDALVLQVRHNSGAWTKVWGNGGNLGDVWRSQNVDLNALGYNSGTLELRFQFNYDTGFLSDIALDEIRVYGPGRAGTVYLNNATPATAAAAATTTPAWPDTQLRLDVIGSDNCSTALTAIGTFDFRTDNTPPTVSSFILPAAAVSPVSVQAFEATDNIGVTGYLITESATKPAASDPRWQATRPIWVSTGNTGAVTFYAWAKDAGGNVSTSRSATVTIASDGSKPVVDVFTLKNPDFTPIEVLSFSASDNSGLVTGYRVTENATPPAAGAAGWLEEPPTEVPTAANGTTTFYAWVKDSAGNVSTAKNATITVKVDSAAPVVSTFTLPATSTSLTFNVTGFSATDTTGGAAENTGVAGYMITEVGIDDDPSGPADDRWRGEPQLTLRAAGEGTRTFKAWAKDNAGNISAPVSRSVTITLPASCDYDIDPAGTYIEAENFTAMGGPTPWSWTRVVNPLNDGGGSPSSWGYLNTTVGGTGTVPNGSRTDYPVNFPTGGTYYIWVRALDAAGTGGGDSLFWGIDGKVVGVISQTSDNRWAWTNRAESGANNVAISAGQHTINLWPRESGQKIDAFFLTTDNGVPPQFGGQNVFSGTEDRTTTIVTLDGKGIKGLDPTCVDSSGSGLGGGGGSGSIIIPDGRSISGNPFDVTQLFTTDQGRETCSYRVHGAESDGFNGFALNSKWSKTDIGGYSTSTPTLVNERLRLAGRGVDIWGNSDSFSYLYQGGKSGNFTIDVKVDSIQNVGSTSAKGGIMARQSLAANSVNAAIFITPGNQIRFQRRTLAGGTTVSTSVSGQGAPKWLRLRRSGNTFYGYYSTNGSNWVLVGSSAVSMSGSLNIGLAVTSRVTSTASLAQFDNFMFMPAATSGMNETWTGVSGLSKSVNTTNWGDGHYGLSVRCSEVPEPATNLFGFNSCVDATPSSLSVHSGQTVSGSEVSLNALFNHGGNVGNFSYQINGINVLNPWNSYALVPDGSASTAVFRVTGTDPDCGGKTLSATGTIVIDNSCSDPDPSTLTILSGQTTGGPAVDLTKLFISSTGDVVENGLTFKINGKVVGDPHAWDSRAYGTTAPQNVNFEVVGIDPDCGVAVTAMNQLLIDNSCVLNPPSISFDRSVNYVGAGRAVPYTITVRNEDSFNCGSSTLTLDIDSDSNTTLFNPSFFPAPSTITSSGVAVAPGGRSATVVLAGRQAAAIEMAVGAKAGSAEWNENDTRLTVSSQSGSDTETAKTKIFLVSPITHNSVTTYSPKWGGTVDQHGDTQTLGKWGTSEAGSKYGNFTCLTCHEKNGLGIKWMREEVTTPDGSTWGTSGQVSLPIVVQDARPGASDWGHDDPNLDGSGRTSSNRGCEVCHSKTLYHRFDTEADPDGAGPLTKQQVYNHFPNRDCTDCHRHSLGFTASCIGCHGNPPLDATLGGPNGLADIPGTTGSSTPGTHYKHVVVLKYPCEYCHAGWRTDGEMPKEVNGKQQINHKFNVFGRGPADPEFALASAGHYTGQDGVNYEVHADQVAAGNQLADGTIPPGKGTLTCENIYCHGGTDSMGGTNPQWNGNIACNSCHGTSASNTPPGYSHTTHVGRMGQACSICHGDGTINPLPGSNGHVNGSVGWDLTAAPSYDRNGLDRAMYKKGGVESVYGETGSFAPSALYGGGYGTCTNVACHYGVETPVWNSGPATCTTCHNNGSNSGKLAHSSPNTGNHTDHASDPVDPNNLTLDEKMVATYINKCESCHGGNANTGTHPGHINVAQAPKPEGYPATVYRADPSDYVDFGGMTYDSATATCTSTCHDASAPGAWGSAAHLSCEACHMAPYLGPTVVDPDGEGTGMAASGFGSHLRAVKGESLDAVNNWDAQCRKCHPYHHGGLLLPTPPTAWDNPGTVEEESENMAFKLGLLYPVTGGIHLGGTVASGSTEAEMCWNCHGTDDEINEWGYNSDTNGPDYPETHIAITTPGHTTWAGPAGKSYNYGWLYTDAAWSPANLTTRWVDASGQGMYRRDAYQHVNVTNNNYVLSRRISSVHSVDFTIGANPGSSVTMNIHTDGKVKRDNSGTYLQTLETADKIRCTYCHDLHDLNRAVQADGATNETATGPPYLRGSWMGNPYAPDVPPLSTYVADYENATTGRDNRYVSGGRSFPSSYTTPRLFSHSKASRLKGGYFIDANSNRPTAQPDWDSLEETAGLCTLCHGSDVNTMDYYTGSTMWRTGMVNGHANSTLGGDGAGHSNARNIFDARRGQTSKGMAHQSGVAQGNEWGKNTLKGGPYESSGMSKAFDTSNPTLRVTGWYGGTPGDDPADKPAEYSIWYNSNTNPAVATNTAGIGTDGSDSGRAHSFTCSKCHSPHATGLPALLITNCLDVTVSNWSRGSANPTISQANTCHSKTSTTTGWHKLAPKE